MTALARNFESTQCKMEYLVHLRKQVRVNYGQGVNRGLSVTSVPRTKFTDVIAGAISLENRT